LKIFWAWGPTLPPRRLGATVTRVVEAPSVTGELRGRLRILLNLFITVSDARRKVSLYVILQVLANLL